MSLSNLAAAALAFGREVNLKKPSVTVSEIPYRKIKCGNIEIRTGGDYPGKDLYIIESRYGYIRIEVEDFSNLVTALTCILT